VRAVDVDGLDEGEVCRDVHHDAEHEEVGDQVTGPRRARRDEQPPGGEGDGGNHHDRRVLSPIACTPQKYPAQITQLVA